MNSILPPTRTDSSLMDGEIECKESGLCKCFIIRIRDPTETTIMNSQIYYSSLLY